MHFCGPDSACRTIVRLRLVAHPTLCTVLDPEKQGSDDFGRVLLSEPSPAISRKSADGRQAASSKSKQRDHSGPEERPGSANSVGVPMTHKWGLADTGFPSATVMGDRRRPEAGTRIPSMEG